MLITTGKPKCIVHCAGGSLLEHPKEHRLHCDLGPGDRSHLGLGRTQPVQRWDSFRFPIAALSRGHGASFPHQLTGRAWPVMRSLRFCIAIAGPEAQNAGLDKDKRRGLKSSSQ
ncbi:hypothetical protein RA280_14015 [Cupriavidus sp. CV2]|uniref:hypothetical protein n=1 Tax=Cupriavidus ulmosensis TaxID=3065913 RepID=UPI00296AEDC0|nr:hypothetical protein [Cupriavidus sp. CV2]MDW3682841.1 hypothetical protein [Cupriavidus sp. CV2]